MDTVSDVKGGRYLSRAIPGATLTTYLGEGHLFPVDHWAEMLAVLG